MSDSASSVTLEEQRSFIKIHYLLGTPKWEIEQMLRRALGKYAIARPTIHKWFERFKGGQTSTEDEPRSGRPKSATDESHQEALNQLLIESRSWSTIELAHQLNISTERVREMLHNDFGMRKVCTKWVPLELTPEQKEVRVMTSYTLLSRYRTDPRMLDRVVAIDETWVRCYQPTKKSHSMEWHKPDESR
jgi:histone-lysine N-methyltransferase SETMAR